MKTRDIKKLAKDYGFAFLRSGKGTHEIWSNGKDQITINFSSKDLNHNLAAGLVKQIKTKGDKNV